MSKVYFGNPYETVTVNVYDIATKKILFTGGLRDTAIFIGTSPPNISNALKKKRIIKKKYAVRYASQVTN